MSSSDRITAQLAAQKAAAEAAAQKAAADAAFKAANAHRANPQPHKVDKSVLRVKEGRGRR